MNTPLSWGRVAAPFSLFVGSAAKRFLILFLLIAMIFVPAAAFSGSGSGTSGDPWQITTCSQWMEMTNAHLSTNYYKLMNDIDLGSCTLDTIGDHALDNVNLKLDGNYKTVYNGTINYVLPGTGYQFNALFGYSVGAGYKNFAIKNTTIRTTGTMTSGNSWTGILMGGDGQGGYVQNVSADADCHVIWAATFSGGTEVLVGGFSGYCQQPYSGDSYAGSIEVTTGNDAKIKVGGICGSKTIAAANFNEVYSSANITRGGTNTLWGGIAGTGSAGTCNNCFYDTTVTSLTATPGVYKTLTQMRTQSTFTGFPFGTSNGQWKMSESSGKWYGYPMPSFVSDNPAAPSPTGTVDWTNAGPVANQTSQGYSWTSSDVSSPYIAIKNPAGTFTNTSKAASGSDAKTVDAVGTWYIYVQDGATPTTTLDSDTIVVNEVTESGTVGFTNASAVSGASEPYTWTYSGVSTHFINITSPSDVWTNSTITGTSGSGNKVVDEVGTWTIYIRNTTQSLASDTISVAAAASGAVDWDNAGPVANQTSQGVTWSSSGLSSPYISKENPAGTFTNTSVGASGTGSVTINMVGTWTVRIQDGNVPAAGAVYDSDTLVVNEVTESGTVSFTNATAYTGSSEPYTWTYSGVSVHFINITSPSDVWTNSTITGTSGSGNKVVDEVGTWTIYIRNTTQSLASDTISVSATPTYWTGTVDFTAASGYNNTAQAYSWTSSFTSGSPRLVINASGYGGGATWAEMYNQTVAASGSSTITFIRAALGSNVITYKIHLQNDTHIIATDTELSYEVNPPSGITNAWFNTTGLPGKPQGFTGYSTSWSDYAYGRIKAPNGTYINTESQYPPGATTTYNSSFIPDVAGLWWMNVYFMLTGSGGWNTTPRSINIGSYIPTGTIAWTNPTAVARTSQGYSWSTGNITTPRIVIKETSRSLERYNSTVATSGSSSYTTPEKATYVVYLYDDSMSLLSSSTHTANWVGAGTAGDPKQISTAYEWSIAGGSYYKLMNDIDFSNGENDLFISSVGLITGGTDELDGNKHVLKNVYLTGLAGCSGSHGAFWSPSALGGWGGPSSGAYVGTYAHDLAFENITMVYENKGSPPCLSSPNYVGMIAAEMRTGNYPGCPNLYNITIDATSSMTYDATGSGNYTHAFSMGPIGYGFDLGSAGGSGCTMGAVKNFGSMVNINFNVDSPQGPSLEISGVIGRFASSGANATYSVSNTYYGGTITAPAVSSICGITADDGGYAIAFNNTYYDSTKTTQHEGGPGKTCIGDARSTAQMKTQSTYVNWDFTNIWKMSSSGNPKYLGYPMLYFLSGASATGGWSSPTGTVGSSSAYTWIITGATTPHIKITAPNTTAVYNSDVAASGSSAITPDVSGTWTIYLQDGTSTITSGTQAVSAVSGGIILWDNVSAYRLLPQGFSWNFPGAGNVTYIITNSTGSVITSAINQPQSGSASVSPYWDGDTWADLYDDTASECTALFTSLNPTYVLEWDSAAGYVGSSSDYTFQVVNPYGHQQIAIVNDTGIEATVDVSGDALHTGSFTPTMNGMYYVWVRFSYDGTTWTQWYYYDVGQYWQTVGPVSTSDYITIIQPYVDDGFGQYNNTLYYGYGYNIVKWNVATTHFTYLGNSYLIDDNQIWVAINELSATHNSRIFTGVASSGTSGLPLFNGSSPSPVQWGGYISGYSYFYDIPDNMIMANANLMLVGWNSTISHGVYLNQSMPSNPSIYWKEPSVIMTSSPTAISSITDSTTTVLDIDIGSLSGTKYQFGIYFLANELNSSVPSRAGGYFNSATYGHRYTYSDTAVDLFPPGLYMADYYRWSKMGFFGGASGGSTTVYPTEGTYFTEIRNITWNGNHLGYIPAESGPFKFANATLATQLSISTSSGSAFHGTVTDPFYIYFKPGTEFNTQFLLTGNDYSAFTISFEQQWAGNWVPIAIYNATFVDQSTNLITLTINKVADLDHGTMTTDGTYRVVAYELNTGGGGSGACDPPVVCARQGSYVASASVAIGSNYLSPSTWGELLAGIFGLDSTMGRGIFGIMVVLGFIALILVLRIRSPMFIMIGAAMGVIFAYLLGLFDLWVVILLGLVAAAGIYAKFKGGGGEPPEASGIERSDAEL